MGLSLRPDLARIVARIYLEEKDWDVVKGRVLASNALQCRSARSAVRMERELRHRLGTLTDEQLKLLVASPAEDRAAISWLAAIKQSPFVFEFATEVLLDKIASHDPVLRFSDYETYVETRAVLHPEVARLTASSRNKVRQILHSMLKEAGLVSVVRKSTMIHRPALSPPVLESIVTDNPLWLAGFLVTDDEIGGYRWVRP